MKKILHKKTTDPVKTIFNQPNRPKIHVSSIAAVFNLYNDRNKQISLLWNDPWSEEMKQARKINLTNLRRRLSDFGLDHRFDWSTYLDGKYGN